MQFLSLERLKSPWSSVLLSNPLTKDEFQFIWVVLLVHVVVSLRNGAVKTNAKISSKQYSSPLAASGGAGLLLLLQLRLPFSFSCQSRHHSRTKKTWNQIQE